MILVHSSPTTLIPYRRTNLGVLSSPRRFYNNVKGWPWAADNDAFEAWDEERYEKMISTLPAIPGCLFVTAPDVVGDAAETLKRFEEWRPRLEKTGLPIALVGQDGLHDPPWEAFQAFFVGGTTEWKLGEEAALLIRESVRRKKWTHMGRVNSIKRIKYAKSLGCDSVDGSSANRFKDVKLRKFLRAAHEWTDVAYPLGPPSSRRTRAMRLHHA